LSIQTKSQCAFSASSSRHYGAGNVHAISLQRALAFVMRCGLWLCHGHAMSLIVRGEYRSVCGLCFCRFSWPPSAARVCAFSWMLLVSYAETRDAAALLWSASVGANQSLFSWSRQ
jgi:hypothetical protein